jgi:hypothetical protein
MNNQEAKFILGAYRPDGRDSADPMFMEALHQSERDPELHAWFERERAFDTVMCRKLHELAPPAELRAAILAGARASRPRRTGWTFPVWIGVAAAIAILAVVSMTILPDPPGTDVAEVARLALHDLDKAHHQHVGYPDNLSSVQAALSAMPLPFATQFSRYINIDELRRKNCRSFTVGNREVFELCFQRDGTWFHLYAVRRRGSDPGVAPNKPYIATRGEHAAAAWADAYVVYALVASSQEALRRLI